MKDTRSTPQQLFTFLRGIRPKLGDRMDMARDATDRETLEALLLDAHAVRGKVAANLNTPRDILRQLAQDASGHVRAQLALNCNAPNGILARLARDNDRRVIKSILSNRHVRRRKNILRALAENQIALEYLARQPWLPDDMYHLIQNKLNALAWRGVGRRP